MDVLTCIEKRREITQFQNRPIAAEVLDDLVRSIHLAPSGNNLPSREFVLVTGRDMLERLSQTTPYMQWLATSAAGFIIVGNEGLSKYWLQDASIAGGFLWLTAVSRGLGAAWGAVYHAEDAEESRKRERYVREQLNVPGQLRIVAIIGLGYPEKEPGPKAYMPLESVFHREVYRQREEA